MRLEAMGKDTPAEQPQPPPITPVQRGGSSGSSQGQAPPTPAPQNELQLAEEAAATDREADEDSILASFLQDAFVEKADEEQAAPQAARVPEQPVAEAPAGGSSWTYL